MTDLTDNDFIWQIPKETVSQDNMNYNFYGDNEIFDQDTKDKMIAYAKMSKAFMNKPFNSPLDIVGNFDWHEKLPYEEHLFYDHKGNPLIYDKPMSEWVAVDFGCGPGRMINRASKLMNRVDGIDVSEYALDYAKQHYPNSNFYVSSGIDVGDTPELTYDLAFSTISIQHIPSISIRSNILAGLYNSLKTGGYVSIQVGFNTDYKAGVWSAGHEHASYNSDFWNAQGTNGHADMVINLNDLEFVREDFENLFSDVSMSFFNVAEKYGNWDGAYHAPYWATHWLFIKGRKY